MTTSRKVSKKAFFILGIDRSSVSAVSSMLSTLGVGVKQSNSLNTGELVFAINRRIFSFNDFASNGIKALGADLQSAEKIPHVHAEAQQVLTEYFQRADELVYKDSNTIKALPFWREVFAAIDVKSHFILAISNPMHYARGYQKKTGYELELGLLLWLTNTMQAIQGTVGASRILVSSDLLIHHRYQQSNRICRALDIDFQYEQLPEASHPSSQVLQSGLEELRGNAASKVLPLCSKLYTCLIRVAKDDIAFDSVEFQNKWQEIEEEYVRLLPMLSYLDSLLKKRRQLRNQLRDCHKSLAWRIVKPLRWVDDYLRQKRRQAKLLKRAIDDVI